MRDTSLQKCLFIREKIMKYQIDMKQKLQLNRTAENFNNLIDKKILGLKIENVFGKHMK